MPENPDTPGSRIKTVPIDPEVEAVATAHLRSGGGVLRVNNRARFIGRVDTQSASQDAGDGGDGA